MKPEFTMSKLEALEYINKYNLKAMSGKQIFNIVWWYYFKYHKIQLFAEWLKVGLMMHYAYQYASDDNYKFNEYYE